MSRLTAVLLLAGCVTLQVWAQAPTSPAPAQAPAAPAQAPAAPAQASQTPAAEQPSSGPSATAYETSQFPLDRFQEFSAIQTRGALPGSFFDGHVYRSGNLMRMEGSTPSPSYFISDLKKKQTHGLSINGCIELKYLYSRTFPFMLSEPEYKYERVPVGEETVDGHQCKVEDLTISNPKNPRNSIVLKMRMWEAEDLQGFPIRMDNRREGGPKWSLRYKNVVLGPQDLSLFTFPNKCQSAEGLVPLKKPSSTPKPKSAPPAKPQ